MLNRFLPSKGEKRDNEREGQRERGGGRARDSLSRFPLVQVRRARGRRDRQPQYVSSAGEKRATREEEKSERERGRGRDRLEREKETYERICVHRLEEL